MIVKTEEWDIREANAPGVPWRAITPDCLKIGIIVFGWGLAVKECLHSELVLKNRRLTEQRPGSTHIRVRVADCDVLGSWNGDGSMASLFQTALVGEESSPLR